jgi:sensor histidine kinase YesM
MLFSKKNRILLIFLFFVEVLHAQQFPSTNLTTVDGLPNNSVYSILKDSRGILWLGTENGISAIKNNNIQNFYTTDGLAHNTCRAIIEDKNNNLWFGSFGGGLTFYDGKRFKIINTAQGLVNDKIRTLFIHEKYLYFGTQYGFSVIDIATHKIVFSDKIKGVKNIFQVMNFYVKMGKVHFVSFDDGEWSIDLKSRKMKLENHEIPHVFSLYSEDSKSYISHINVKNNLFNQFSIRDHQNKVIDRFSSSSIYWDYVKDKRGLIFAAGNGVNLASGGIYQLSSKGFIPKNADFGVQSFNTWSLEYDSQLDLLYVGTLDKGLYTIVLKSQIQHYNPTYFNREKLEIVAISQLDDVKLVLGTEELLFLKGDKIKNEITRREAFEFLSMQKSSWNPVWNELYKNISFEQFEFKDLKIFNSQIWLTTNFGLINITKDGEIISSYTIPTNEYYLNEKNQLLFQQSFGRLHIIDSFDKYKSSEFWGKNRVETISDVVQFIKYFDRTLLLTSSQGLINYQNGKFFSYFDNAIWNEKELVCGTLDSKNNLLVANAQGDVFILDVFKKFKVLEKIPAKTFLGRSISFIKSYKDYIIIGNEKGVILYKNGQIRLIDDEQGLSNKIIKTAYLDGNILNIGTLDGYFKLDLEKIINPEPLNPQLKVSNIEVNFAPISSNNFKWFQFSSNQLELAYSENTLSIDFEPYQIAYPSKLVYSYKLNGMKNAIWSNWSDSKTINLTYLPAGKFDLEVRIKDLNSGKITLINLLAIRILPPFWKTWWFIIVSTLTIIVILYLAVKQRIAFIKKQEQEKGEVQKRLSETKMEALQSQMNPHFIFNAMNSIQNFILGKNTEEALQYMGEFSKLIRHTLNNSSRLRISLEDELKYLKSYTALENLRFNKAIKIKIKLDESIDPSEIEIPPMLIQPFVENAFVHAFNSKSINPELIIDFSPEPDYLLCTITDNGKGMDAEKTQKLHQSKGIELVKERISLLQSDSKFAVEFSSVAGHGTRVVVRLGL